MSVKEDTRGRHGLSGRDRRKLKAAVRAVKDTRHLRRVQAVLLVAQGRPVALACGTTGLSRQGVYNSLRRYRRRRRPADLADRPRSGRPRVARPIGSRQILSRKRV